MLLKSPKLKNIQVHTSLAKDDEERLFSMKDPCVEALFHEFGKHQVEQVFLRSVEEIKSFLQNTNTSASDTILILRQSSSWGRFFATSDMFHEIFTLLEVFPPFLDFLRGFGFKLRSEDENFGGYRTRIHSTTNNENIVEFMYNLRYADKHGRDRKNPWSIRHTAVYQQFNSVTQSSIWILLQPSEASYRDFKDALEDLDCTTQFGQSKLFLHELFFWNADRNWRDYINFLQRELLTLEEKALFSRVGQKHKVDYELAFADCQDLQRLRKMMQKCRAAINIAHEVVIGFEGILQGSVGSNGAKIDWSSLRSYKSSLRNHQQSIQDLLESSAGISQILFQILEYRNDETLISGNNALRNSSEDMKTIAVAAKEENKSVAIILSESRKDSHMTKILTFVAMIYLPASLIASIFNSNLVQVDSGANPATSATRTSLHLAKEFWLYPVLSIALLVVNFAMAACWARWSSRAKPVKLPLP